MVTTQEGQAQMVAKRMMASYFLSQGHIKSKLSSSSREEIDVSKLTQAIFRKRMGNGRNGNKNERRYRKKSMKRKNVLNGLEHH